jgi:hypothetical protein
MNTQPTNVMHEAWDYLIILDACRHDAFERTYRDFLDPVPVRAIDSVGTATSQWRQETFVDVYPDILYVSANPYIANHKSFDGFRGGAHFFKVIDVWKTGWDQERGTVLPATVTQEALRALLTYPGKRLIIHYLQPHAPYLSLEPSFQGFSMPNPSKPQPIHGLSHAAPDRPWQRKLFYRLLPVVNRSGLFGEPAAWKLRQLLGMAPASPMDAARRALGRKGLWKAYVENLRRVLADVARLLPYLEGTVVITSDHGERLGEGGRYTHTPNSDEPLLRKVPWLVLRRKRQRQLPSYESLDAKQPAPFDADEPDERTCIEDRLRALGYME